MRPEIPAHDLVFQIFKSKMMMAHKWAKSPTRRKMFILEGSIGGNSTDDDDDDDDDVKEETRRF